MNHITNYTRTKSACYVAYFTMSSVFSLPPLLFVTLRQMYGISYTLLGTLVLTNFCTQLVVDIIFTIFPKFFNVCKMLRSMPLLTFLGLTIYALVPSIFPNYAYVGLLIGTIVFSVGAGLSEVLLSPTIAAIPSENPDKDMSMLHSLYAFGVFSVVVVSTLFLKIFGTENWMYLTLFFAFLPIIASILFMISPIPEMSKEEGTLSLERTNKRTIGLIMCVGCIFLGSCAENAMANWISGYMENALHLDKAIGDILGMAMFAILLGITRIAHAKFGGNISNILFIGMSGAAVCYLVAGLTTSTILALIACVFTGIFTSMLWPGTLILMEEKLPGGGVAAFAFMAAGGDLGASVAPQLMGIVIDKVSTSSIALELRETLNLSVEQIGLKAGMLVSAIFPMLGTILVIYIIKYFKNSVEQVENLKGKQL